MRDLNSMRQFNKLDNHFVDAVFFVSKEYNIANRVLNEHLRVVLSKVQIENSYKLTSAITKIKNDFQTIFA